MAMAVDAALQKGNCRIPLQLRLFGTSSVSPPELSSFQPFPSEMFGGHAGYFKLSGRLLYGCRPFLAVP
jgi:hypothetical protein